VTDIPDICGIWRLQSCYLKNLQSDERSEPYGVRPNGVLILLPEGRMAALLTPTEQKRPETEADQADAFRKLVAYSGHYRLEPPDRFVTLVDIAWLQPWVGSQQARRFALQGDTLDIITEPKQGLFTGDAMVIYVLSWVRENTTARLSDRHVVVDADTL
jgi:hypothetical protein